MSAFVLWGKATTDNGEPIPPVQLAAGTARHCQSEMNARLALGTPWEMELRRKSEGAPTVTKRLEKSQ